MKKEIIFFCDHCGSEVADGVKDCHVCGRIFTSIRCPACNFSGEEELFKNGCPSCGYVTVGEAKPKKKPEQKQPKSKAKAAVAAPPLRPFVRSVCIALVSLFVMIVAMVITR
ncbi:MAG: hypothetical protein FWG66_02370 [Spirochaetes bacterium]|nr:hypothetical protein [Spirochaetota bacterium]